MTKRKGAIIPNPIDTENTRKIVVCIPDTVEWLSLFTGLVSQLRYGWYWDRSTGDLDAIRDRAKRVYFEMQDQDGDCMTLDCDEVANCLETSEAVKEAVRALIGQYLLDHPAGSNMPNGERNRALAAGFNPDCLLDIVWAQSVGIVERINQFIVDILESLTEVSTVAGVAGVLASLPGVENLGVTFITDLATMLVNVPLESYNDDYSVEWSEALECEIFCLARHDCEIKFDQFWNIIKTRVEAAVPVFVPPADFLNIQAWASRVVSFAEDLLAVNKADLMFYFLLGGVAYGNVILNELGVGQKAFDIALMLASDEPSNDWEVICLTCPEYENITVDANPYPVPGSGLTIDSDGGTFTGGDNRIINTPWQAEIVFPVNRRIRSITMPMAFAEDVGNFVTINGTDYDLIRGTHIGGSTYEYIATIPNILSDTIAFQFAPNSETSFTFVVVSSFVINVWEL